VVEDADDATFAFGRTAEVVDEGAALRTIWTIVGPTEADLAQESSRSSRRSPARCPTGRRAMSWRWRRRAAIRRYRIEKLVP
jgi:hypothetical protein